MGNEMKAFIHSRGIVEKLTVPGNSYQNGVAERFNRILTELVRAMLSIRNVLPNIFGLKH